MKAQTKTWLFTRETEKEGVSWTKREIDGGRCDFSSGRFQLRKLKVLEGVLVTVTVPNT